MDAGFITAEDWREGQSVDLLIQAALARNLEAAAPESQPLDLFVSLLRPALDPYMGWGEGWGDGVIVTIEQPDSPTLVAIGHAVRRWDAVDHRIAPSILRHLQTSSRLLSFFDPAACLEVVATIYWFGDDSGEEVLLHAADNLADARRVKPEDLSEEEVRAYAEEYFQTPARVHKQIPRRFHWSQDPIELEELHDLARRRGLEDVAIMCECAWEYQQQAERLPEYDQDILELCEGEHPFNLFLEHVEGDDPYFMREVFDEYMQYAWQGQGLNPVHACRIDPNDPESVKLIPRMVQCVGDAIRTTRRWVATIEQEER